MLQVARYKAVKGKTMSENKLGGNYNPPQTPVEELLKETAERVPEVGQFVIWHDSVGKPHNALVTVVWNKDLINVVFISDDENKQDSYGRQIERATSCSHKSRMYVHGFYWRFIDEEPNHYIAPFAR